MNRIFTLLIGLLFSIITIAQSPDKISYQAVVRDADNKLVVNTQIGIQISILNGIENGTIIYRETQKPTTNENGLFCLEIGAGSTSDNFSTITWTNGPYFVKTEIDISGGINYTITGTSQLLSVPFALHAKTAETVVNSTYLTQEIDGSVTNEIQNLSLDGDNLVLSDGGSVDLSKYIDEGSKPTEAEIDELVSNNGYLTSEVDGSVTNEIQNLTLNDNNLVLSDGGSVDLSEFQKLTEVQVDDYVSNNGYLTQEVDGSVTNEIQNLTLNNNNLVLSDGGSVNLSEYQKLTEVQVDDYVSNNGYLTQEVDGSVTNEIQNLTLNNNSLVLSNGGSVDLSRYQKLTESQVDGYVSNNGYLTQEVDGSVTNEIQNLSLNGNELVLSNGGSVNLSNYQKLTESQVDNYVSNNGYLTQEDVYTAGKGIAISNNNVVSLRSYQVGDFAHGGVVFYVDETGQHGLVVARNEANLSAIPWNLGTNLWVGTDNIISGLGAGAMNTMLIIARQGYQGFNPNGTNDYAALSCSRYVDNHKGDWYLPSISELWEINNNLSAINATIRDKNGTIISGAYWSSSETVRIQSAYQLIMGDNSRESLKSSNAKVRAIRAF